MADREMPSLLLTSPTGYTEAQLVVLVLSMVVVGVGLLSYFVVAPEYERHLDKKFAAMVHASAERELQLQSQQAQVARLKLRKYKSLGAGDIESGSDDDFLGSRALQRRHTHLSAPVSLFSPRDSPTEAARIARKERNARRRKSETDALRKAQVQLDVVHRADLVRKRVQLRELEEEIAGTVKANEEAQAAAINSCNGHPAGVVRRYSNNDLDLTDDRLKMLQEHPAECVEELKVLAKAQATSVTWPLVDSKGTKESPPDLREVKRALNVLHDVLSFYLSVDHRDMNKLNVFCNSLLQHDGLNRLRAFETSRDQDVRALSNSIIEKAVPAIWH